MYPSSLQLVPRRREAFCLRKITSETTGTTTTPSSKLSLVDEAYDNVEEDEEENDNEGKLHTVLVLRDVAQEMKRNLVTFELIT